MTEGRIQNRFDIFLAAIVVGLGGAFAPHADAQTAPDSPSLLQQLSDETQRVYGKARLGMVRVQLPTPQWLEKINQQKAFLQKWGDRIDPAVREQIVEQQAQMFQKLRLREGAVPASQPTGIPPVFPGTQPIMAGLAPSSRPAVGKLEVTELNRPGTGNLILVATGLLVDDKGHAAFPLFVNRSDVGDASLPAMTGDGRPTTARFIGSDRLTNLTVLQLANPSGTPAALGHNRPDDGVLTLVIAADGGARLVVWSNLHPEPGLAVLPDGSVAGFGFEGHFLGASTAKPIVEQLIAHGEVHRAKVGVVVEEVAKDDLMRQTRAELGTKPAIRVVEVDPGSAAERGGVRANDLILAIDHQAVGDAPTFAAVIATHSGKTVLHVLRGSQDQDLTVTLNPQ
jgi:S1-C subfamily serine protease